jgi:hypothetical protein
MMPWQCAERLEIPDETVLEEGERPEAEDIALWVTQRC